MEIIYKDDELKIKEDATTENLFVAKINQMNSREIFLIEPSEDYKPILCDVKGKTCVQLQLK